MNNSFYEGFKYVSDSVGANISGTVSNNWINSINNETNDMIQAMINEASNRPNTSEKFLQGWIAEIWHKHTFNINSKINLSSNRAIIPDASEYASSDVSIIDKNGNVLSTNQLKYYNTAKDTIKELGKSPWENYCELKAKAIKNGNDYPSFDEFLSERNVDKDLSQMSKYYSDVKVFSADQLVKAKNIAYKKYIAHLNRSNPTKEDLLQAQRWKEVYDTLDTTVKDGKGNSSIELTYEQSIKLAKASKEGRIDKELLEECSIDVSKLITTQDILKEAFTAGLSAATIAMIISIVPCIIDVISKTVKNEKLSINDFAKYGLNCLSSAGRSFVVGSITAAIVTCCKTGKFGSGLVNVSVPGISSLVVVVVGTVISGIKLASGKINRSEMVREIMQLYTTTAFSFIGGTILGVLCDGFPLAYMLGSLIGGIVGGFAYKLEEHIILSLCKDHGLTFFGLVEQDYKIPEDVLEDLHLDVFKFEKINICNFEFKKFEYKTFQYNEFSIKQFGVRVLSRDLIDVYKIGYK